MKHRGRGNNPGVSHRGRNTGKNSGPSDGSRPRRGRCGRSQRESHGSNPGRQRLGVPAASAVTTTNRPRVAHESSSFTRGIGAGVAGTPAEIQTPSGRAGVTAPIVCVDPAKCYGCATCTDVCPTDAIAMANGVPRIGDDCFACGVCVEECPEGALTLVDSSS